MSGRILGSAQKYPENQDVKWQRQGPTMGAARVIVAVQHRPRPWTLVPASAGMSPLTLAVPPGPAQLCHTPRDPALELSKVALAALIKLRFDDEWLRTITIVLSTPEAAVLSTWQYPVLSTFSSHQHCALWGPQLGSVILWPCVACSLMVTAKMLHISPSSHSCLPSASVSLGPGLKMPVIDISPSLV